MTKLTLTATQKAALDQGFIQAFGATPTRYFSAPGRTELSGNHTDHQHGRVLAGAVKKSVLSSHSSILSAPFRVT